MKRCPVCNSTFDDPYLSFCPNDGTPVVFTSLPNPRRKGRYRLSCYYCGRQAEMDWPPPEARG